ncbi:MAG: redoxin family protein [Planctomycetes bacterium]|nr:redoxin family protein [Planctomycetota bacterium]
MPKLRRAATLFLLLAAGASSCKILARQIVTLHREAWGNGLTKREGKVENGLQSGDWTYFFESGQRRAKGRYHDDHQVGPWTYWYENGVVEWAGSFDDTGRRTGEWQFQYPDETLRARGLYVADAEEGPWQFHAANGQLERAGSYEAGRLSGFWRHWHADGKPKAEGLYWRGQRLFSWRLWDEAGAERRQDFGGRPGLVAVSESWGEGVPRRAGVLSNGKPAGRWQTWHANGAPRLCAGFQDGQPHGPFVQFGADGAVRGQGSFAAGKLVEGVATRDGLALALDPVAFTAAVAAASWPDDPQLAAVPGEQQLALLLAECAAPVEVPPVAVATQPPPPPPPAPALVAALEAAPDRIPAPAQPDLTVLQREELDSYVLNYLEGQSETRRSRRKYGPAGTETKTTGPGRRSELEGKPLPMEVFQGVDGTELDIRQYRGKKHVIVVVLRGFVGEVCVYCIAQTEALAQCRDRLDSLGIEVVVVYPGPRENEESFEKAYALTFGKGAPPYRVFYDPDLEFVQKLGIAGELAYPSTFLLDKEGTVQYAFVGEHRADRPAAKKLIELIEGMRQ